MPRADAHISSAGEVIGHISRSSSRHESRHDEVIYRRYDRGLQRDGRLALPLRGLQASIGHARYLLLALAASLIGFGIWAR